MARIIGLLGTAWTCSSVLGPLLGGVFTRHLLSSTPLSLAFLASRSNVAKARELKCEEPRFEKNRWLLGIDSLLRALAADRSQQFPVDLIKRFEDLKTDTYRYQILGGCSSAFSSRFLPVQNIDSPPLRLLLVFAIADSYFQQELGTSVLQIPRTSKLFSHINLVTPVSISHHTSIAKH